MLAKTMPLHTIYMQQKVMISAHLKNTMCSGVVFASTEVVHRPELQSPLQIDPKNLHEIRKI